MKKTITAVFTGLILMASLLSLGCSNVLSSSPAHAATEGNVTVTFSAGKAALMPSLLDFDVYAFTFTKAGDGTTVEETRNKNQAFTFSLDVGAVYTLEVKAYKGSVHEDNLGATGSSAPFTVLAKGTTVQVTLNGFLTEGVSGTFSYNIEFPAGTEIDKLELYLNETTGIDLLDGAFFGENGISNSLPADAGRYMLIVWLSNGERKTEDYNGVTIYSNTTTYYGTETEPIVFKNSDFRPFDEGERVYYWHGFDVEGSREFYNMYHYESSNAIGTRFETYIDSTGTYEDVLKLEPPNPSGYELRSMMLTRPVSKAGTYKLSMDYLVEKGSEEVNFFWYSTGGIHGDAGGWPIVVGTTDYMQAEDFGKWLHMEGTFEFQWDDDEIGIIARNNNNDYGLRDATIYIRNLVLEDENGELPPIVSSVSVNPASLTLVMNNSRQLKANKPVTWSVDPPGVVAVGNDGMVTAIGIGNAVITAASTEDPMDFATVAVKVVAEGTRFIAIGFDDGPNGAMTPQFLDVLADKGAYATFFCIGTNIAGNQELARRLIAEGHEIGNHSYYHTMLLQQEDLSTVWEELNDNQELITAVTGVKPVVFRAPALLYSAGPDDLYVEKQYGENYEEACRQLGLSLIDTTDHQRGNFDWDGRSPEAILAQVKTLVKDWGILCLHDWPPNTLEALPDILDWLHEEGFTVLSVSKMAEKRMNAAGLSPAYGLEPGKIYYNLAEMPPHVSSITVDPITITEGETGTLSAAILPSGAAVQKVYWYSDDPYIAEVDEDTGIVTALSPGTAVIRAAAGGMRAFVTVTVDGEITVPDPYDTITSWVDEAGFNIKGEGGPAENDQYYSSNADWDVDSYKGYTNVLRLSPDPNTGMYYWKPNGEPLPGGGVALTFVAPYTGEYSLSMDVWVDTGRDDASLIWYNCWNWAELSGSTAVSVKHDWFTRGGTIWLTEGQTLGLLAHSWYGDTDGWTGAGLKHSTIYIKDLELVYKGPAGNMNMAIMDIPAAAAPPPPTETQTITLQWDTDGHSLISSGGGLVDGNIDLVKASKDTVTLVAPVGATYQWRVDGWEVEGATNQSFTFDSALAKYPVGEYNISVQIDTHIGDAITITVK